MNCRRSYIFFSALLVVHLLFFLSSVLHTPAPLPDSDDYRNASRNIYSQGILYCGDLSAPIREEQFTRRPPLYPLLVGIEIVTGTGGPLFLLQIAISMLSIFFVYRIFNPFMPKSPHLRSNLIPLVAGIIFLLATPAQYIYASRTMSEIPFQLFLVLSAWTIFKYFRSNEPRFIWFYHLFITLGMATKPVLYPFAILSALLSVALFIKTRKRAFILSIAVPLAWIILYSTWNYNRTGSTQYSSIQTANLLNYNLRYYLMNQEGPQTASAEVDRLYETCGSAASYRDKNSCLEKEARDILLEHPLKYAIFHLKGSLRFFLDPGRFDIVSFFNLEESGSPGFLIEINKNGLNGAIRFLRNQGWGLILSLAFITLFKLLKIGGFILYLFQKQEQLQLKIFLVILVGYIALVTGPLGASRFLLPVELLIMGGAVCGWTLFLSRRTYIDREPGCCGQDPEKNKEISFCRTRAKR